MFKYSINLAWSDEDDCYLATIPEFPGLITHGDTPEEAAAEAEIAAAGFIEIYEEDGDPIPEPIKVKEYSGNLRIRIPKTLHQELSAEASHEGISLNSHIMNQLSSKNAIKQTERKIVEEVQRALSDRIILRTLHQHETMNSVGSFANESYVSSDAMSQEEIYS